jgi:hypothetical protein
MNIAQDDGNDPFVVERGMSDLHITDLRGNRVRADEKNESICFFDAAHDLFEPVHSRWDGFPVHPDILLDGSK